MLSIHLTLFLGLVSLLLHPPPFLFFTLATIGIRNTVLFQFRRGCQSVAVEEDGIV